MAFALTSVTGAANTGLTTPGYTMTEDQATLAYMRQFIVSALTGTQTGVRSHSSTDPFLCWMSRPAAFRDRPTLNVQGQVVGNSKNEFVIGFKKGVLPIAGGAVPQMTEAILRVRIPAGAEIADMAQLRALFSLIGGVFNGQAVGIVDSLLSGTL